MYFVTFYIILCILTWRINLNVFLLKGLEYVGLDAMVWHILNFLIVETIEYNLFVTFQVFEI